ncbi:hypothetical protein EDD16DRAFT_1564271 [Pisolithus croceorrhizus]|nr:hypothetical protein EDD16DRAFT_1564271 [Pisolithus croceorrhizus]
MGQLVLVSSNQLQGRGAFCHSIRLTPPENIHAVGYDDRLRPLSFHFYDRGNMGIAAYLNHGVVAWDLRNQTLIWRIEPTPTSLQIASSALLHQPGLLAVKAMHADIHVYNVGESHHFGHFRLSHEPDWCYPTSLSFILGNAIVCGTNSGKVVIWVPGNKEALQSFNGPHSSIIALGSSQKGHATYISIWRADGGTKYGRICQSLRLRLSSTCPLLSILFSILVLFLAVGVNHTLFDNSLRTGESPLARCTIAVLNVTIALLEDMVMKLS